jgi:V/A-type H+-transporting ATPase subunit D
MSDLTPTRSAAIQLGEERRTMREGYAFLDEKCLLLAGEMLRAVKRHRELERELAPLQAAARAALRAAVARHGQHGLRVAPAAHSTQTVQTQRHALLGVPMLAATLAGPAPVAPPAVNPSPEAKVCRRAYAALLPKLTELAAVSGNLARLYAEYRKTVRRVRVLQDLLLPEVEQQLAAVETGLEELEQDEAGFLQRAAQAAGR